MSWDWIKHSLEVLPRSAEPFLALLWQQHRLRYGDANLSGDAIDEISARLVCAALDRREQLLVILPDNQPRRPALLFATALIMSALDTLKAEDEKLLKRTKKVDGSGSGYVPESNNVLYFGSTVGIRRQLAETYVHGGLSISLGDVFQPVTTVRGKPDGLRQTTRSKTRESAPNLRLPKVICVYAPAEPLSVLNLHAPDWIAVDCGDGSRVHWLPTVLNFAQDRNIPVLAWGGNPLADYVEYFKRTGDVFSWASPVSNPLPSISTLLSAPSKAFSSPIQTEVTATILTGPGALQLSSCIRRAVLVLSRSPWKAASALGSDAIRLHWNWLRTIESLCVPYSFHEAEASLIWGMRALSQWQSGCEKFCDALRESNVELCMSLEQVHALLEEAADQLKSGHPPLWSALTEICDEGPRCNEAILLVFTSVSRKRLFALALLARKNVTEDELREKRIWLLSLHELRAVIKWRSEPPSAESGLFRIDPTLELRLLIVGIPSPVTNWKLLPALLQERLEFFVYPHQAGPLERRCEVWNSLVLPNMLDVERTLIALNRGDGPDTRCMLRERVVWATPTNQFVSASEISVPARISSLVDLKDPGEEMASLFAPDDEVADSENLLNAESERTVDTSDTSEMWCESALRVQFENGWRATFAPDDTVNVITHSASGQRAEERFVRSLVSGQRVVLISGQRRQSLYDLIVSRVHQHPAIEMHIALIRRWQEEFISSYQRWQHRGRTNMDTLLLEMQDRGSVLVSPLTLRAWLRGNTLCPQDTKDLQRVAEILGMDFVKSYHRRIYQAASRLRGLHRSTSHRLNRWLEQQSGGQVTLRDNDVIDETLGLTFTDIRSSLLILRVETTLPISGLFLRNELGRLERDSTYANE